MTNRLPLFADWSVHQKLNRVSSVQLRRSGRAFKLLLLLLLFCTCIAGRSSDDRRRGSAFVRC